MRKCKLKVEKFTDVCMTGGMRYTSNHLQIFQFSTDIFSAEITPEMLRICRVTKVEVFFLLLVYAFIFSLFQPI